MLAYESTYVYWARMSDHSLTAVMHLLLAYGRLEERFSGELGAVHGLALKEALLLMHLVRAPRERLSRIDLAKRLNASPSTITRMAIPLEKLGLIGREADARDARLAYVVFTILVGNSLATPVRPLNGCRRRSFATDGRTERSVPCGIAGSHNRRSAWKSCIAGRRQFLNQRTYTPAT